MTVLDPGHVPQPTLQRHLFDYVQDTKIIHYCLVGILHKGQYIVVLIEGLVLDELYDVV